MRQFSRVVRIAPMLLLLPFQGCSCTHNRQSIYPNNGQRTVRVDTRKGVKVEAPYVAVDVPSKQIPVARSTDLDVPMLKP